MIIQLAQTSTIEFDEMEINQTDKTVTFWKQVKQDDGSFLRTKMKTEEHIIIILT